MIVMKIDVVESIEVFEYTARIKFDPLLKIEGETDGTEILFLETRGRWIRGDLLLAQTLSSTSTPMIPMTLGELVDESGVRYIRTCAIDPDPESETYGIHNVHLRAIEAIRAYVETARRPLPLNDFIGMRRVK